MKLVFNPIQGSLDYVASSPGDVGIAFPLAPNLGGTGVANPAGSTLAVNQASTGSPGDYLGGDGLFHSIPTTISLFLDSTNSDIAGYETLEPTPPGGAGTSVAVAIPVDNTVIEEFIAAADLFNFVSGQVLHVHAHLAKTSGTKGATVYCKLFHRTSGGVETLMGTSDVTSALSGAEAQYDLHITVADTSFATTDRLVLKFYGNETGAGTDPTVTLYFEGASSSRIEIGTVLMLNIYTQDQIAPDFVKTRSGTITRVGGYISQVAKTGGRTLTITRTGNYISSIADGTRTWTFTRDGNNAITAWSVT